MENTSNGNKRLSCPLYGCKRVYTDANSLQSHIQDHDIPAQSLPGKTMTCSTVGCGASFVDMQKLMGHMRHHHKPNIYFLCESCHAKLRSYRGLLTHLHTCSKVPRPNKLNPAPSAAVPVAGDPPATTQDSMSSTPPQLPSNPPQPDQANQEVAPPQNAQSTQPLIFTDELVQVAPAVNPEPDTNPTNAQVPQRPKTPENSNPPKSTPQTPPATIWKSGHGLTPEKRILWQHTRGRYTCVQCGHTVTNRKEMTEHSSVHHTNDLNPKKDDASPATTSV